MAKPRAKTIQERVGFSDKDLKAPLHDQIMLWLDDAVRNHFDLLFPHLQEWNLRDFDIKESGIFTGAHKQSYFNMLQLPPKQLPPKTPIKAEEIVWGYQIVTETNSKYTVGSADLMVSYERYSLIYDIKKEKFTTWSHGMRRIFFEVKTKIPSLGELIRQIRLYQTHVSGKCKWVVVSPEMKFEEHLKRQGIDSIKYEPNRFQPDEVVGPDGTVYNIPIK